MEETIIFHIIPDQAEKLCNHFNRDISELEEYDICELLDRLIDEI